jgi:hypothetical protein
MTELTPEEVLDAFRRGLEHAARRVAAAKKAGRPPAPRRRDNQTKRVTRVASPHADE